MADTEYCQQRTFDNGSLAIPLSMFKNVQDTGKNLATGQPEFYDEVNHDITWGTFVEILTAYSQVDFLSKDAAPLYSPTVYQLIDGQINPITKKPYQGYRNEQNATTSAMAVADMDGTGLLFSKAVEWAEQEGIEAVIYTTASNRTGDRLRIVIPFSQPVVTVTQKRAMRAITRALGYEPDSTKMNPYSLFYVPGRYQGADNQFAYVGGIVLSAEQWWELYPEPPADIERHVSKTDFTLDPESNWSFDTHGQDCIARYRSLGSERRRGLASLAVSMAMSAVNFGCNISVGELASFLEDEQQDNPPSNAKNRRNRRQIEEVATFGINKAGLYVADPVYLKMQQHASQWAQWEESEPVQRKIADLKASRISIVEFMMADETAAMPGRNGYANGHDLGAESYSAEAAPDDALWPIYKGSELPDTIPPRQWVLDVYWCRGFVSSTSSGGGSGKTSLMLGRAIQVATGRTDITGEHVFRVMPVLYCCFEDDKDEIDRRLKALCIQHQINPADLDNFHYHVIRTGDVLAEYQDVQYGKGKMREGALLNRLRRTIINNHYGVVILDPFVNTHELEENDNKAMNFVKRILVRLGSELHVAVDVPHHTAKGQREAGDADNWRGGSALRDGLRLCYTLTTMTREEAETHGIDLAERSRYIRTDSAKVNITRGGQTRWFQLASVNIGNADDAYYPHGDNVQAISPWEPPLNPEALVLTDQEIADKILTNIENADPPYACNPKVTGKLTYVGHAFQQQFPNLSAKTLTSILRIWERGGIIKLAMIPNPNRGNKNQTYEAVIHHSRQNEYE